MKCSCCLIPHPKDVSEFKKVRVSFDTIEWENGFDLDPEFLYEKSVAMSD
ncbi:DUF2442 domain-containing protein [candidate division KSB1 bacterium]|nr:DUF2442 domain-containing protein [candidate division KSB1 bacterium]